MTCRTNLTTACSERRSAPPLTLSVMPTEKSAMTEPEDIFGALGIDQVLVLRFLGVFSRFEYSLKRSGFAKGHDPVEPDWDTYANGLRGKFQSVDDPGFSYAVKVLVNAPPRKQILSKSSLDWKATIVGIGEQHENYVLRLVRIVRNNLFHGGKMPGNARDESLVKASYELASLLLEPFLTSAVNRR